MKDDILKELKKRSGTYTSGEELSERLGVSRTAIWKSINQLKEMGYVIESQTKKGYRLAECPDSLAPFELKPLLTGELIGKELVYKDSVDSTNTEAKRIADGSFVPGTVVIAEEQTAGRGRLGRHWISPKGKGIWMSILLKPQLQPYDGAKMTLLAACAVCEGIEETCGLKPGIKWPNDIVAGGRKLCGILTEMGAEMDEISWLVVGIGINANLAEEDFSEEVKTMATSIRMELNSDISRKQLAAKILNSFDRLYGQFTAQESLAGIIDDYRSRSAVIGREIRILSAKDEGIGTALDITEEGHLLVRMKDGTEREIASGEVSVRGIYGYV